MQEELMCAGFGPGSGLNPQQTRQDYMEIRGNPSREAEYVAEGSLDAIGIFSHRPAAVDERRLPAVDERRWPESRSRSHSRALIWRVSSP